MSSKITVKFVEKGKLKSIPTKTGDKILYQRFIAMDTTNPNSSSAGLLDAKPKYNKIVFTCYGKVVKQLEKVAKGDSLFVQYKLISSDRSGTWKTEVRVDYIEVNNMTDDQLKSFFGKD